MRPCDLENLLTERRLGSWGPSDGGILLSRLSLEPLDIHSPIGNKTAVCDDWWFGGVNRRELGFFKHGRYVILRILFRF